MISTPEFLSCDVRINCGDLVGYYFEAKKVVSVIRQLQFYNVKGNHEEILETVKYNSEHLSKLLKSKIYGKSYEYALKLLDHDDFEFLFNLPLYLEFEAPGGKLYICHGSPISTKDYLYPDRDFDVQNFKLANDIRWLIVGNTHFQMEKIIGQLKVINPGSVGQARDGSGFAQWAILDTTKNLVEFQKTNYDKSKLIQSIKSIAPLNPKLWNVLEVN